MHIQKLELHGFKSFPDRTVLHFGRGIACVVGPNGCGKSNIVDAIKWVMGEQSARSLRGSEMLDVIFAGSTERPPVGFAEVRLTFSARDGEPFPGDYARFDEIEVGRRLHRSGTSEYFLNQTRARRRDIIELFLDTGVGNNLYSFIEQGSIGRIVHARASERRSVIDEAAGISRYKARREEAQGRLEQTAAQLDRAGDVEDEMARRLRQLERQVVKASRFRRMRARVRQREIVLALVKYADLAAERRQLRTERRRSQDTLASAERDHNRVESEVLTRREELDVVEAAAATWREELAEVVAATREREGVRGFSERRLAELAEEGVTAAAERAAATSEQSAVEGELSVARASAQSVRTEVADVTRLRDAARSALTGADAARNAGLRAVRDADVQLAAATRQLATAEAQLEVLVERRRDHPRLVAELMQQRDSVGAQAADARAALARANDALASRQLARTAVDRELSEASAAVDGARTALERVRTDNASTLGEVRRLADAELAAVEDAVASLRRLQGRLQGLDSEAQAANARGAAAGALALALPEARTLAELLELDADEADALSRVLGRRLLLPVVESEADVLRAADVVRAEGSAALLWAARPAPGELRGEAPGPATAARVLMAVTRVDTFEAALAHHRFTGGAAVVVSTGERVDSDGVVHMGDSSGVVLRAVERERQRAGLRARVAEMRAELGAPAAALAESRRVVRATVDEARLEAEAREAEGRRGVDAARAALDAARGQAAAADIEIARAEGDCAAVRASIGRADERATAINSRLSSLHGEAAEHIHTERVARERVAGAQAAVAQGERGRAELAAAGLELDTEASARRDALQRAEVTVASLSERARSGQELLRALDRRQQDAASRAQRAAARMSEIAAQRARLADELDELAVEIERLGEQRTLFTAKLDRERDRTTKLRAAWRVAKTALRDVMQRRDAAAASTASLDGEVQRVQLEVEGLRSRMDERYQVSLPGMLDRLDARGFVIVESDALVREPLQIGTKELPGVPDLEIRPAMLGDYDGVAAMVAEVEALRSDLRELGEVNLGAVDEYGDVAGRHADLAAQRNDLEESVARIRAAIAKMNRLCRQRFRDAFDRVNEYFQELYPRLVGGGSARLSLTNEEDLLATGVEIFVQPPGKRLQNLSLLSGGEKAMTAIALLLSLFQVKPSPFCLLDEVDAPLDEANGTRFNEILREMSDLSQFILVTHNRKTMECADTLYGITMSDPGVSALVSVRIGSEAG